MSREFSRSLELVSPDSAEAGRILVNQGLIFSLTPEGFVRGDLSQSEEAINRGMSLAKKHRDKTLEVRALVMSAQLDIWQLRMSEGIEKFSSAIDLGKTLNDPVSDVRAYFWMGVALFTLGRLNEAERYSYEALSQAQTLRDKRWIGLALTRVALLEYTRGEWMTAQEYADTSISTWTTEPTLYNAQILLAYQAGDFQTGEEWVEKLIYLLNSSFLGLAARFVLVNANGVINSINRSGVSPDLIDEALQSWELSPSPAFFSPAIGEALAAAQKKDYQVASRVYTQLAPYTGTVNALFCVAIDRLLGLLAQTMGMREDAIAHFEEALALCGKAGYIIELAWSCYDYANMLAERNSYGDRDKAASLLEEALSITNELGMKPLLEKVTALKERVESAPARTDLTYRSLPTGLVTIMFTDIQDSTPIAQRLGDLKSQEWLNKHNRIIRAQVAANNGIEVRYQGDGFMLTFPTASDALKCAIAIQREFDSHNQSHPDEPILVRMGLHTGEIVRENDDLHGVSIILAARISAEAKGGQVLVSGLLKELVDSRREFDFSGERQLELKGLSGLHTVYELVWNPSNL